MSVYFVTGSLGSGKGLAALYQLRNYANNGFRIAGNLDINLDKLIPGVNSKTTYVRVPDRPTAHDLELLGQGNNGYDPDENSLLVLDECVTWLNARSWNDKGRMALIDWLIHSRKHGWDVILIAQSFETLDKQIVDTLMEFHVSMNNLAKFNIPIVGKLFKGWTKNNRPLKLPKMHFGRVMYKNLVKADSWSFKGTDLYDCYDTKQIFSETYPHGTHSLLSRWHLEGRYLKNEKINFLTLPLKLALYILCKVLNADVPQKPQKLPLKPKKLLPQASPLLISFTPSVCSKNPLRSSVIDGFRIYGFGDF